MDPLSDDDALELPKSKFNKETIDALKSLQKEKRSLPKRPQSEAQKAQFAKAKAIRNENRRLRAEAKALLLKNKTTVEYTKAQQKAFKKNELEELKVLLGKKKEQENLDQPLPKVEKQTNKKVIEEPEGQTETESEEEN